MEVIEFLKSERGQASITDALLFLMLASGLATTMFYFTGDYGVEQQEQLNARYLRSYTSNVFKSLLWSPFERPGGFADYLLAYSKEQFTVTGYLPEETGNNVKRAFAENLEKLNQPFNATHDFAFAIYEPGNLDDILLLVFKDKDKTFYCTELSSGDHISHEESDNTNLESFLNHIRGASSSEGIVTYGNKVKKTVFIIWPKGINKLDNVTNLSSDSPNALALCDNPIAI